MQKLTKKLPDDPGVYLFRGPKRAVLYIGKATSLRSRVASYFRRDLMATRGPLLVAMVEAATTIDFIETDSVLEALILEAHLIKKYQPEYLAVERLFFGRNTTTAMAVGQARGMILLAAAQHKVILSEFTPLEVKMALTGYGRADKKQIQMMVKTLLKLPELPKPDDAADALAIAICHLHSFRLKEGVLA